VLSSLFIFIKWVNKTLMWFIVDIWQPYISEAVVQWNTQLLSEKLMILYK